MKLDTDVLEGLGCEERPGRKRTYDVIVTIKVPAPTATDALIIVERAVKLPAFEDELLDGCAAAFDRARRKQELEAHRATRKTARRRPKKQVPGGTY